MAHHVDRYPRLGLPVVISKSWYYSRPLINPFINKTVAEIQAARVTAAIVLTHSYTDTEWFHKMRPVTRAVCFTKGRIAFTGPDGDPCKPVLGSVFFYYGPDVETFETVFGAFGWVFVL